MKSIDTVLGGPCIYWRRRSQFNAFSVIDYSHTARAFEPILYSSVPFSPRLFVRFYGTSFMMKLQIIRPRDFVHFNI